MATITASVLGGNWNTTTAWVGGVIPGTGDDVILALTSGNITVSDARLCRTLDATNYINTFKIDNGITLSVSNNTITLGASMIFDQTTTGILSNIIDGSIATTITFNGIVIPNLTLGSNGSTAQRIVTCNGTTPTVKNLVITNAASQYFIRLANVLNVNTSLLVTLGSLGAGTLGSPVNLTGNVAASVTGNAIIGLITIPSGGTLNMSSNLNIENITFSGTGALVHNNRTVNFIKTSFNGIVINTNTVEWWNVNCAATSNCTFTSNLNVGNDFNETGSDFTSSAGVTINVKGNISFGGNGVALTSNLLGIITITAFSTGTVTMVNSYSVSGLRLIIGSASTGYTLGSATRLNFTTANASLTLVGNTATASFFSTTAMTLTSLWTFDVNRTATGGSEIILPNLNVGGGSGIVTLTTETKCSNFSTTSGVVLNGAKLLVSGNIAVTTAVQGTSTIEMTGGVARTMSIPSLSCNLIINKSGGVAVDSLVNMSIGGTTTLSLNTNTTFGVTLVTLTQAAITINNPSASQFYDLTINGGNAYTLNHLITILRNLTLIATSGNITFGGTAGWTCANLLCPTPSRTISLVAGVTYTTTTSVNMLGTNAGRILMTSSSGSIRAIWTLSQGASQSIAYVNGTRIDSSLGQTVWSFGVLTSDISTTLNWGVGVRPAPYGYIIFN